MPDPDPAYESNEPSTEPNTGQDGDLIPADTASDALAEDAYPTATVGYRTITPEMTEGAEPVDSASPDTVQGEAADSTSTDLAGYDEVEWQGFPRYQCRYCPFDTLERTAAEEHYRVEHRERVQRHVP